MVKKRGTAMSEIKFTLMLQAKNEEQPTEVYEVDPKYNFYKYMSLTTGQFRDEMIELLKEHVVLFNKLQKATFKSVKELSQPDCEMYEFLYESDNADILKFAKAYDSEMTIVDVNVPVAGSLQAKDVVKLATQMIKD